MSNFNYMDSVPVKIAEKYKPPPRIYQLPTTIVNKLQLPEGHYYESPQYSYDFQLERKVLSKLPEYRRMRQTEREARQSRHEKREQETQRQIEERHKQMLGAVSYPNAAELSSSESEKDEENSANPQAKPQTENLAKVTLKKDMNWQHHNFDNILQPTVLSNEDVVESNKDVAFAAFEKAIASQNRIKNTHAKNNLTSSNVNSCKLSNSTFNYKDFEEDTSSPFDNIELKTINDLDILAQVLHETQLKANKFEKCNATTNGELTIKEQHTPPPEQTKDIVPSDLPPKEICLQTNYTTTPIDLDKVNFSDISLELTQPPTPNTNSIPTEHYLQNSFQTPSTNNFTPYQMNSYQIYHNQNFLYSPNCNQIAGDNNALLHKQMHHYIGNNNTNTNFSIINDQIKHAASYHNTPKSPLVLQTQQDELQASKSKSVPDIIRELRDEVRNSEIRRTRLRNHSYNQSDEHDESELEHSSKEANVPSKILTENDCLGHLDLSLQSLARNISSMGFPLQRVAKVAKIYGDDDKKIVEHLIPLTELLDLGFEETRISEALIKFDNNKEKALEHLIS